MNHSAPCSHLLAAAAHIDLCNVVAINPFVSETVPRATYYVCRDTEAIEETETRDTTLATRGRSDKQ